MTKTTTIPRKPQPRATADKWVGGQAPAYEVEPMKRLTVDIPESLHRAIKSQCAMRGTKIVDEVRELLSHKYQNP